MLKHGLSVIAFMVVSFAVQGMSHFMINKDHFASVGFLRPDPILPMGLGVMIFQGLLLSLAMKTYAATDPSPRKGLIVSLMFGAFLVSYISIVEPSKYLVPSIGDWILVEATAGLVQFTVYGLLLGSIYKWVK